ncbi:MAG: molybdenum cofactor biosynthesis protein B [Alphaproteobacteria bacterium]
MAGLDESLPFLPLRIAILTVSDTRTPADDRSGDTLQGFADRAGHSLAGRAIVRDDIAAIRARITGWIAEGAVDVIIATGGTGLTGRDVTVEAVRPLFDKEIDGFSVVFHQISFGTVGTSTLQSRACAGLVGSTYVFCLPGSTGAVKDAWTGILQYQLDSRHRPCNLAEILPRLEEHKARPA